MSKFDPRKVKHTVPICGATHKRMFKTEKGAILFIESLGNNMNANQMRAYQCNRCGQFHITSKEFDLDRRRDDYARHQQNGLI